MNNRKITLTTILLIPIAIAINFVGGQIATALTLPVYIDVIGTILVGALAGPVLAIITGVATNLILGITNPSMIPFAIVSGVIGLIAGIAGRRGWFTNIKGSVITLLLIFVAATITSSLINIFIFGGASGFGGATVITTALAQIGQDLYTAVFTASVITETLDKVISIVVVVLIIRALPNRTLIQFPLGEQYIKPIAQV